MARPYATIGRASDNDVVIDDPTVSNHHARLSWVRGTLVIEDLSSANGTFVDGERISQAKTRVGADVRLGAVPLPWSTEGLAPFLKLSGRARTVAMSEYKGAQGGVRSKRGSLLGAILTGLLLAAVFGTGILVLVWKQPWLEPPAVVRDARDALDALPSPDVAKHIGTATAGKLAKALTPMDALTRNTAVKFAARTQGPFHVEQVAEIWGEVRKKWRYVNDPEGREYFATATETIENGYVGDCDDFAIALASMVIAIGGKARVVLMDGPGGGHAYAEACVHGEPKPVATALTKHYKNAWRKYLTGKVPSTIAFRTDAECPIWLNLDWNSSVPGGAYEPETWAVAVYEGGKSEALTPAGDVAKPAPTSP